MRKWIVLCFLLVTVVANAQVDKMLGKWYTFDDKTGDMASCVEITAKNGVYSCVVLHIYKKNDDGSYEIMKAPYPKGYEEVVGSELFIDMVVHKGHLKGKFYDPESKKHYYGKVGYDAATDELLIRGSLDKAGLLGRSQNWKRKK